MIFQFEEDRVKKEILHRNVKRVLLQFPEGLKNIGLEQASILEKMGIEILISADPCYGACDLPLFEAKLLNVDLILHYGHNEFRKNMKKPIAVIYIDVKANIDINETIIESIELLKPWNNIGLLTTIQHIHKIGEIKQILKNNGKTVYIGDRDQSKYPGQILGCNYNNAKAISNEVEAFLLVGGGNFHALGLFLATMKPVVLADPFQNKCSKIEKEGNILIKKSWSNIFEAKKAKNFGILVGLKSGQNNYDIALKIKKDLKLKNKKSFILTAREINSSLILQFPTIDAYINTACPRISLDRTSQFNKPILTVKETYVMLGMKKWEDLLTEGFL